MKHYKDFKSQQKIAQRQKIDAQRNYIAHNKCYLIVKRREEEKNYIEKRQTTKTFLSSSFVLLAGAGFKHFLIIWLSIRQIMHLCIVYTLHYIGVYQCILAKRNVNA